MISQYGTCGVHGSILEFWCRRCQCGLCGRCLFEGHDQRHVVQMEVVIEEKKSIAQRRGQQKLARINSKKAEIMEKLSEGLFRLAAMCQEAESLSGAGRVTKQAMDAAQNALDVGSILECLQRLEQRQEGKSDSLGAVGRSCKGKEGEEVHGKSERVGHVRPVVARTSIRRHYKSSRSISLDDRLSLRSLNIVPCDAYKEQSDGQNQPRMETDERNIITKRNHNAAANDDGSQPLTTDSAPEEEGVTGSPSPPTSVASESTTDTPPRFLRCFVHSDDGRQARMRWESGRLHLYALSSRCQEPLVTLQVCIRSCY